MTTVWKGFKMIVTVILASAAIFIVAVLVVAAIEGSSLRYSHQANEFNTEDRAAVDAVKKSPSGTPETMKMLLAEHVDGPVLRECAYSLYRYRGGWTVAKVDGKRPDEFRVTCSAVVEHCVTHSSMLRAFDDPRQLDGDGPHPICYVNFHWYYTEGLGVYKSDWKGSTGSD